MAPGAKVKDSGRRKGEVLSGKPAPRSQMTLLWGGGGVVFQRDGESVYLWSSAQRPEYTLISWTQSKVIGRKREDQENTKMSCKALNLFIHLFKSNLLLALN